MNTYRIARVGTRYHVIEELPDKGTFEIGGFPTPHDARLWLDDYLRRSAQGNPEKPEEE